MNDANPYRGAFRVFGACKDFTEIRILNTPTGTVSGIFSTDDVGADALMHEIHFRKLEHYTVYQVLNNLSDEYRTGKHCNVLMPYLKCLGVSVDIKHSTPKCITLTYNGGGVA